MLKLDDRKYDRRGDLLVLVDLEKRFLSRSGSEFSRRVILALNGCRVLLAYARLMGVPVAYMRGTSIVTTGSHEARESLWIDGFEPTGRDMVFQRIGASCFSSSEFMKVMDLVPANLAVAGLASEIFAPATLADASRKSVAVTFLQDASARLSENDHFQDKDLEQICEGKTGLGVETAAAWIARISGELRQNSRGSDYNA